VIQKTSGVTNNSVGIGIIIIDADHLGVGGRIDGRYTRLKGAQLPLTLKHYL